MTCNGNLLNSQKLPLWFSLTAYDSLDAEVEGPDHWPQISCEESSCRSAEANLWDKCIRPLLIHLHEMISCTKLVKPSSDIHQLRAEGASFCVFMTAQSCLLCACVCHPQRLPVKSALEWE